MPNGLNIIQETLNRHISNQEQLRWTSATNATLRSYTKKTYTTCSTEDQVPVLELWQNIRQERECTTPCKEYTRIHRRKIYNNDAHKHIRQARPKTWVPPMEARPRNIIRINVANPTSTATLREDRSTDTARQLLEIYAVIHQLSANTHQFSAENAIYSAQDF